ncbi:uncharacterized protein PHA67_003517 [Liasis olivaceus]
MASPALGALLLLLLTGRGAAAGLEDELCPQAGALRCPQLHDSTDTKLCCGTCRLPSCCPAGEAHLEGQRCPREAQPTLPPLQKEPRESLDWRPLLALLIVLIVLMLWVAACYCKKRFWRRGTYYFHPSMPDYENQDSLPLSRLLPPSPSFLEPPPPYEADPPSSPAIPPPYGAEPPGYMAPPPPYDVELPPYTVEDPRDNWDRPLPTPSSSLGNEGLCGEAAVGTLVHRNVSVYSSTSTLEADALADE